jgi:hypothetical protein
MWISSPETCYYAYIGISKSGKKFCVFAALYLISGERDSLRPIATDLEGNLPIPCTFSGICVEILCLVA